MAKDKNGRTEIRLPSPVDLGKNGIGKFRVCNKISALMLLLVSEQRTPTETKTEQMLHTTEVRTL